MNIVRRESMTPSFEGARWEPARMLRDLMRWDPFRELAPTAFIERELSFVPDVDVKETPEGYVFKADLPGVKDQELEISFTGTRMTISGQRTEERRDERDNYFTTERSYGAFTRSFTLPAGTDVENARADLANGVLTIVVPKRPESQPRRITVQSSEPRTGEARLQGGQAQGESPRAQGGQAQGESSSRAQGGQAQGEAARTQGGSQPSGESARMHGQGGSQTGGSQTGGSQQTGGSHAQGRGSDSK